MKNSIGFLGVGLVLYWKMEVEKDNAIDAKIFNGIIVIGLISIAGINQNSRPSKNPGIFRALTKSPS